MKIFHWESRTTYIVVAVFVLVFIFGLVKNCSAAEFNVDGGIGFASFTDACDSGVVAEASMLTFNRHLDTSVGYVGEQCGSGKDEIGSFEYASVTGVVNPFGGWWLGLGLSARTNPGGNYEILYSWLNFSLSVAVDLGKHWRVEGRHFSNAGIYDSNRGQNHLMVGYIF